MSEDESISAKIHQPNPPTENDDCKTVANPAREAGTPLENLKRILATVDADAAAQFSVRAASAEIRSSDDSGQSSRLASSQTPQPGAPCDLSETQGAAWPDSLAISKDAIADFLQHLKKFPREQLSAEEFESLLRQFWPNLYDDLS